MNQIERIKHMEAIMEKTEKVLENLRSSLEAFCRARESMDELESYYAGEDWHQDFSDDENGKLPKDLKRGILSEDGIWNLLAERDSLLYTMNTLVRKASPNRNVWEQLYASALKIQNERTLSPFVEAGSVSAAILSKEGNIYTGVCVDTACSLGMCAERNAIAHMIANNENQIDKMLVLMPDGKPGLPCGSCRELMMQLGKDSENIEILLDMDSLKSIRLKDLLPRWWGSDRF